MFFNANNNNDVNHKNYNYNDTHGGQALDFVYFDECFDDTNSDRVNFFDISLLQKYYFLLILVHCHFGIVGPYYYISGYFHERPSEPPTKLDSLHKCASTPLLYVKLLLTNLIMNDITFVIEIF